MTYCPRCSSLGVERELRAEAAYESVFALRGPRAREALELHDLLGLNHVLSRLARAQPGSAEAGELEDVKVRVHLAWRLDEAFLGYPNVRVTPRTQTWNTRPSLR